MSEYTLTKHADVSKDELLQRFQRHVPGDRAESERALRHTLSVLLGSLPLSLTAQIRGELPRELAEHVPRSDIAIAPTLNADPGRAAPSREALVSEVARLAKLPPGRAFELAQISFEVLAETLTPETVSRLARELPESLAPWLEAEPRHGKEPLHTATLAEGKPGSANSLAEGKPGSANSIAEGKPGSGNSLAEGKPGSERPISENKPARKHDAGQG